MRPWACVALLLAGCGDTSKKPDGKIQKNLVFEDVPGYVGLSYEGEGYTNPEFRSYKQAYRGDARPEDVTKFYRETLPVHGWALASEDGTSKLTFTKRSERCTVEVITTRDAKLLVTVTLSYKD